MAGNFFRGTSAEQDGRWGKSEEKLMAKMAKNGLFAPILDTKVNLKKINIDVISRWVTQKIIEVVGFEDDILINMVINLLQGAEIDGKKMQLDVTGFLEKQSGAFVAELWALLVDAQAQPSGIPSVFLAKKKEEILQRQDVSKRFAAQQATTAVPPVQSQERTESTSNPDHNTSKDESHRDVRKLDSEDRPRKRSPSPARNDDRLDDRDRGHRTRERSPDRRDRDRDRNRSPDRRDRDSRRDSRGERDDRTRDSSRSDRRRDSRDRHDRDRHHHSDRHSHRHTDRDADRRRDRSPEERRDRGRDRDRDSHRDSHRDHRDHHRGDSRDRKPRHHRDHHRDHHDRRDRTRSPSPRDNTRKHHSRSNSPERESHRRSSNKDEAVTFSVSPARDDSTIEAKRGSRESSVDRDMDRSAKFTQISESVESIEPAEPESIFIDE